jgi:MoxR-like ATPase
MMSIPNIRTNIPFDLPARGSWPASRHVFDEESADAIHMALAAERPLLVRGEPGTGKSQLARAAAEELGRLFVAEVVHSRTEPQDLQWRFDAIARLGEAQARGLTHRDNPETVQDLLDPRRYLNPGVLWWVFDWGSALEQHENYSRHRLYKPAQPDGWSSDKGCVLLIDEIDKADSDVPNSLLETLGNRGFSVPWIEKTIGQNPDIPTPLVIITTNEERELPAAFVRRCLVLNLRLPEKLLDWLCERGHIHFPDANECTDRVLDKAAQQLIKDREQAQQQGVTPPGQAEYIDLLKAITTLAKDEQKQLELLERLSHFALKKYPQ